MMALSLQMVRSVMALVIVYMQKMKVVVPYVPVPLLQIYVNIVVCFPTVLAVCSTISVRVVVVYRMIRCVTHSWTVQKLRMKHCAITRECFQISMIDSSSHPMIPVYVTLRLEISWRVESNFNVTIPLPSVITSTVVA
jgi:hypothetical protein